MSDNNLGTLKAQILLESRQFAEKMKETKESIESLSTSSKKASGEVSSNFNEMEKSVGNLDSKSSVAATNFKVNADKIQNAAFTLGAAVAASLGASVGVAMEFEQKLKDIEAVSGASASELEELSRLAKEMGSNTAFSASEAALGIEELIKAGLTTEQILKGGLKGALDLAAAGNLELGQSAEIAATALNAFKDDNLSMADAANILAGAANASATDVAEMQYGLSQVSAVASGVGLSFQDTSTALAVFAMSGLKGSDAGTSLKTMLSNLQPTTKEQIKLFKELGLMTKDGQNAFFDANGELKSMDRIAGILQKSLGKMTDQQRTLALETIFGSDAVRAGNILYKEGEDGIKKMWKAMSNVKAADVAATKMDTLKGAFDEFKGTLETAGIELGEEFLPALTEIVKKGSEIVRSMNDMGGANIKSALAFAGTTAAIALTATTVGKLGLAVRTLMVSMGPAGWLITGISLLGGAIAGLITKNKELDQASLDSLKTRSDEQVSLDNSIKRYDELQYKSKLTTDELGRFVDINSEIEKTVDPKVIEDLRKEQEELQIKSGLSNEELSEMLSINDELIKKVPETTKKITDQGNAIVDNTKYLKDYSDAQLEKLYQDLDIERIKNEGKYKDLLIEEKGLIEDQKKIEGDLQKIKGDRTIAQENLNTEQKKLNEMQGESWKWSQKEIDDQKTKVFLAQQEVDKQQESIEKVIEKAEKNKDDLATTRKNLAELEAVKNKMAEIILAQYGIVAEKGKEQEVLNTQLDTLTKQRDELIKNKGAAGQNKAEYQAALDEINNQIAALQGVKNKIDEITGQARIMNYELSKQIQKDVIIRQTEYLTQIRGKPLPTGPQEMGTQEPKKAGLSGPQEYHSGGLGMKEAKTIDFSVEC